MTIKRGAEINALVLCVDQVTGEGLSSILRKNPKILTVFHCNTVEQCAATLRRAPVHLAVVDHEAFEQWNAACSNLTDLQSLRSVIKVYAPGELPADAAVVDGGSQSVVRGPTVGQSLARAVCNVLDARRSEGPNEALLDPLAIAELRRLTVAEQAVLKLLARGMSTKEIAGALFVSPRTVETHRSQITGKLSIRSVAGLTKFAIRAGIASLRD